MRVLLTTHHGPPHIGGVERLAEVEARAWAEAGHEVTWVVSRTKVDGKKSPQRETMCPGVEIVRLWAWHGLERSVQLAYPLFGPGLCSALWREVGQADMVHAHGFVFQNACLALLIAWLRGKPCLLTDHGGLLKYRWPGGWALRLLVETVGRISCRSATAITAYNQRVVDLLARLAGDPAKVHFLPNPIDRALFRPPTAAQRQAARAKQSIDKSPNDREKPCVLFVGRLVKDKGIDRLLAAADPGFRLVFCGPADDAMRRKVELAGAEYLPPRSPEALVELYHGADLLALPSWNEGFPVVLQEALACGLPGVTCYEDGYAPYRGLTGLHFCSPEPEAIRERLLDVLHGRPALEAGPASGRTVDDFFPTPGAWVLRLEKMVRESQAQREGVV